MHLVLKWVVKHKRHIRAHLRPYCMSNTSKPYKGRAELDILRSLDVQWTKDLIRRNTMKIKKLVAVLIVLTMLFVMIATVGACDDTHECNNPCNECGGCLTKDCHHENCANKCQGHDPSDDDDNDDPEPSTSEVTAQEWAAALNKEALSNVTVSLSNGSVELIAKLDMSNDKYYYTTVDSENFYSIENNTYYEYYKLSADTDYTKNVTTKENYDSVWLAFYPLIAVTLTDKYTEFTYNAETGTYVAESVTVEELKLSFGIELTFENGKLISTDFDIGGGAHIWGEFSHYGETTVTLPTVHVNTSVAGKTFVYYHLTCEDFDEETLEVMAAQFEGTTIVFGNDGTVTMTQFGGSIIQNGTYSQVNNNIVITFSDRIVNGEHETLDYDPSQCTFDGETFIYINADAEIMYLYFSEHVA